MNLIYFKIMSHRTCHNLTARLLFGQVCSLWFPQKWKEIRSALLRPLLASAARRYLRNGSGLPVSSQEDESNGLWQACRGHVAAIGLLSQLHGLLHMQNTSGGETEEQQWNVSAEAAMQRLRLEDSDVLQGCEMLVQTYTEVSLFGDPCWSPNMCLSKILFCLCFVRI
jgi:hypothetical protein